ncbi:unnamed protein product [Moneuplotes crassus]|uniref:EGF-like domain-containing protein n=1 Tax=Euplotes crassus TaxID=5936 RepID=A0AAD2CXZ1_EUPCR|nr:unnamed protein product [Moneuplotes crassus]
MTCLAFRRKLNVRSIGTSTRNGNDPRWLQQDQQDVAETSRENTSASEEEESSSANGGADESVGTQSSTIEEGTETEDRTPASVQSSVEDPASESSLHETDEEDELYPPQSCITDQGVEILCHHRGLCFQGLCLCTESWHGENCLDKTDEDKRYSEVWTVVLAVLMIPIAFIFSVVATKVYRSFIKNEDDEEM